MALVRPSTPRLSSGDSILYKPMSYANSEGVKVRLRVVGIANEPWRPCTSGIPVIYEMFLVLYCRRSISSWFGVVLLPGAYFFTPS